MTKQANNITILFRFIKSVQGSDPNGAVYWLARMIEGGEDVKFMPRKNVDLASEDIGNANPTAFDYGEQYFFKRWQLLVIPKAIIFESIVRFI